MEIEQNIISIVVISLIITILGVILYRRRNAESAATVEAEEKEKNLECPFCLEEVPYEIVWSQIKGFNLKASFSCPNCKKELTLSKVLFILVKTSILLMVALAINLIFQLVTNSEPITSILFYSAIVGFVLLEVITSISNKKMRVEKVEY